MNDERPPTSWAPEWRCPDEYPPPRGKKVQLLNCTGTAVYGDWKDDAGFVAWAPLLKVPANIKAKLERYADYFRRTT